MLMPEGVQKKTQVFDDFKDRHEKEYETKGEETQRLATYHHNLRYINAMNRQVRLDLPPLGTMGPAVAD
jgi:hypothetical protein